MTDSILVWYRTDLRLQDHAALQAALRSHPSHLLPLYCVDPRQFGQTAFGFPKTGAFRAQFLLQALADLRQQWRSLGSDLVIRCGKPEEIIPQLVQEHPISALYYHAAVCSEETTVETEVMRSLQPYGTTIHHFQGQTLYHPEDLPMDVTEIPELFTHFRKQVESQSSIRTPLPPPSQVPPLPAIAPGDIPSLTSLGLTPPTLDRRSVLEFEGGETAGWARLQDYIWQQDCLKDYKQTRNGLKGANYSSKFSPWLALGCLSPRSIYEQVQLYETDRLRNDSTYWLVFELIWRDYFYWIAAKHGDRLFYRSGLQRLELPWQQDWQRFDRWQRGETGYPLVDANLRELAASGYLSNRGRQNVGSFLTKNLGVDWRMGAEWFESLLIDYDVTSNWGNWQYVAGVGNDARGFRFFNITKQAKDYDPDGDYVKHWLPELAPIPAALVHEPWRLSAAEQRQLGVQIGQDYPAPIVDLIASAQENERRYQQAVGQTQPARGEQSGKRDRNRRDSHRDRNRNRKRSN